jgi:dipeptidyl aminopeptidase/acylaminoacyl peptidase
VDVEDPANGRQDIWLIDLSRNVSSRFTFSPEDDVDPIWSPDGSRIVFATYRNGGIPNLYQKPSGGAGEAELLLQTEDRKWPMSWSSDGRHIAYQIPWDLWLLPLFGDRQAAPLLETEFIEIEIQFSPDGKWFSYSSNESGRYEVYVQPFPPSPSGEKWRISTEGGNNARWRGDGREIFYLAPDRTLMAASVNLDGARFEPSSPAVLFKTRAAGPLATGLRFNYDVSDDGQRFLIASETGDPTSASIHVIVNWTAELER